MPKQGEARGGRGVRRSDLHLIPTMKTTTLCLFARTLRRFSMLLLALGALAFTVPARALMTADTLGNFDGSTTGSYPRGNLVQGSDGDFYGLTSQGGANDRGTVFKVTAAGVLTKLADFSSAATGAYPYGSLVEGTDGDFYGLTSSDGANGVGTVFKVTAGGVLTKLADLDYSTTGGYPYGSLVQGSDGDFYGLTSEGGANGVGTVFKVTAGGVLTKLADFTYSTTGGTPLGRLVQGSDGAFYGLTPNGGPNGFGTAFKVTAGGVLTKLADFTYSTTGSYPRGSLVQGSDGAFYGLTSQGGASDSGTAFKLTADGVLTKLADLDYYAVGNSTESTLVEGSDGNFYGTTPNGTNYYGSGGVFQLTPSGTLTLLARAANYYDISDIQGSSPQSVIVGTDGNLYGICQYGADNYGMVFRLNTALLPESGWLVGTGGHYAAPGSVTTSATNGTLLATYPDVPVTRSFTIYNRTMATVTVSSIALSGEAGLTLDAGTLPVVLAPGETREFTVTFVSSLAADGIITIQSDEATTPGYTFAVRGEVKLLQKLAEFDSTTGIQPYGSLVQGSDGDFYGLTQYGGVNGAGTAFKVTAAGVLTKLADFDEASGRAPLGSLVEGSDGAFYGLAQYGGGNGIGTAFKVTAGGVLTKLVDFDFPTTGGNPHGSLIRGSDGDFYGVVTFGGINGVGTAFKMTASGELTKLADFDYATVGGNPCFSLVEGSDGAFYGLTEYGGGNGIGTAFKMTAGGVLTKLADFDPATTGGYPKAGLVQGSDGNFYGVTNSGGVNGFGTVFKMTVAGVLTKLADFDSSTTGANPQGGLVQGSDGNFYGLTPNGGAENAGTAFKVTPTGELTKLADFEKLANGAYAYGSLVQGSDGNFYGLTTFFGSSYYGTVFRLYAPTVPALLSDHFTGNSGGVPAGWTRLGFSDPAGTIVESGTTATITDGRAGGGPTLMTSTTTTGALDNFSFTVDIASMTSTSPAQPEAMMAIGSLGSGYALITKFNAVTGAVTAQLFGPTNGQLALGTVSGYAGGAISFTISGDADSFRVTSTVGGYDSGDRLYSAVGAANFDSIDDFGLTLGLALGTESADGGNTPNGTPSSVAYDRVVLTGKEHIDVPNTPPVLHLPTSPVIAEATSSSGASVSFSVSASDAEDGALTPSVSASSGSTFALGDTTVNVSATDSDGETTSGSFIVRVVDTTPPSGGTFSFSPDSPVLTHTSVTLRADGWSDLNGPLTYRFFYFNTPFGSASTSNTQSFSFFIPGDYTVKVEVADAFGNTTTVGPLSLSFVLASQTITFNPPTTAMTSDTIALSAMGGGSGNPVTFSIVSGPGSITGNSLTFSEPGSVVVRASQAGSDTHAAAPDVDRTIVVSAAGGVTAVDDRFAATTASLVLDVLANDSDLANRALSISAVTQPAMGKVTIEGTKLRFTPKAKTTVTSALTFTYTASAGGDSATATVTLLPPPAGNYLGLLSRAGVVRGRITVTVTATGMATGAVRREGAGFSFRGSVVGQSNATFARSSVPVPALLSIPLGALDNLGQPTLAVKMSDTTPGQFLTGTAERSPYDATHPAPQAGRYTLVANLPSGGTGPQTGAALVCTVATNGAVTFGGRLGDNSAGTQGGNLLSGGRFPFYTATGSGAVRRDLTGELTFDRSASPAVTGTLHWKVPAGVLPALAAGVDQDYDAYGLPYTATNTGVAMFSPAAPIANLTIGLPSPFVRRVSLDGVARAGSQRLYFSGGVGYVNPANGFFSGTVSVNRINRPFFGVVLQGGGINAGSGNFIDSNAIRTVTLAP